MSNKKQLKLPLLDLSFLQLYSAEIKDGELIKKLNAHTFCIWILMRANCQIGGKDSGKIYLSLRQMQAATGFSLTTISGCIDRLVELGMVKVMVEGKQKRRYYVIDTFRDTETKEEIVKVQYSPVSQPVVREKLKLWSEGKTEFPKDIPGVTLIQQNASTIINFIVKTEDGAEKLYKTVTSEAVKGAPWEKYLEVPADQKPGGGEEDL